MRGEPDQNLFTPKVPVRRLTRAQIFVVPPVNTSSCSLSLDLREPPTHPPDAREQEHAAGGGSPRRQQTPVRAEVQNICKSQASVSVGAGPPHFTTSDPGPPRPQG